MLASSTVRQRVIPALGFLFLWLLAGWMLGQQNSLHQFNKEYWHLLDDHMITQRVALNFHQTGYPYFNVGEPVSANTSLFWPIALSNAYYFIDLESGLRTLARVSIALSAAAIVIAASLLSGFIVRLIFVVALGCLVPMVVYSNTMWEHVPQMLLVTLALSLIALRSSSAMRLEIGHASLILLGLAFLIRPDTAPIIATVFLAWLLQNGRYRTLSNWKVLALYGALPLLYLGLMWHYYGDFFPNTAHLKVLAFEQRFDFGWEYLTTLEKSGPVPLVCLTMVFFWIMGGLRPHEKLLTIVFWVQIGYVWSIGGDVFGDGRFLLMITPVSIALLLARFEYLVSQLRSGYAARSAQIAVSLMAMLGLSFLLNPHFFHTLKNVPDKKEHVTASRIVQQLRIVDYIRNNIPPEAGSVGLHYLGIGYHLPNYHIVDFLGKAEPHIARTEPKSGPIGHNKWDYDYAFSQYSIAVIPMIQKYHADAINPDYKREKRNYMFWYDCAVQAITSGRYTYLEPDFFGNPADGMGAYVLTEALRDQEVASIP